MGGNLESGGVAGGGEGICGVPFHGDLKTFFLLLCPLLSSSHD